MKAGGIMNENRKILCADVGGTKIKAALVNEKGQVEGFMEMPTEAHLGGPHVMSNLKKILSTYTGYEAIGISTAGQVDSEKGEILYANENIPRYTGTKVKEILEEAFQVPVKVENDVNAAALGEAFFGAGKEEKDLLMLTYGTGVGGALLFGKEIYKGRDGIAGEFGHMITHPEGTLCNCGQKGCYEVYASTTALVRKAMELDDHLTNGKEIFSAIFEGREEVRDLLEEWAQEVSYGLVNLIHIFNPSLILLGGGLLEQPLAFELIERETKKRTMESFRKVVLKNASLGNQAGLLGAASLHLK